MEATWVCLLSVLLLLLVREGEGNTDPDVDVGCDSGAVGVLLTDCPLGDVTLNDGSAMLLHFASIDYELPYIRRNDSVVDGRWTMRGKGFGYNNGAAAIPGPVIRLAKGAVATVTMTNDLDVLPDSGDHASNIHTHGLHVSSDEDNPKVTVEPGEIHDYVYSMPADHSGGTHWYHPHMHPMSELFVGSGAAGMMIVEDATDGTEIPALVQGLPEQVLVLQNIDAARLLDLSDGIENDPFSPRKDVVDTTFGIDMTAKGFTQATLATGLDEMVEEFFLVNGFYQPRLELEQGRWYRWRILNVASVLDVKLALYNGGVGDAQCTVRVLSRDGVYLSQGPRALDFDAGNSVHLHPANRCDVLVRCDGAVNSTAELYDNFNGFTRGLVDETKQDPLPKRMLLMRLKVVPVPASPPAAPQPPLDFDFEPCMPFYLADQVLVDSPPLAFGNLPDATRLGFLTDGVVRPNFFNRWVDLDTTFLVSITPFNLNEFEFPGGWFDADEIANANQRNVTIMLLGEVQQWEITQDSRNHPLHVHVNHYQLVDDIDDETGFHKKGDWVDTIRPRTSAAVRIRFRPSTFIGRVPMHCHNSDHADEGAMGQAFIIANPTLPPSSPVLDINRPWLTLCPTERFIATVGPTAAPQTPTEAPTATLAPTTPAPTRSPNVPGQPTQSPTQPTVAPSASPSAVPSAAPATPAPSASPTARPTFQLSVLRNNVRDFFLAHEGVVVNTEVFVAQPDVDVSYCWVRTFGSFTADLEAAVGALVESDDCTGAEEAQLLTSVYATRRDGPSLVIRPYVLRNGTHSFRLTARQGDSVTVLDSIQLRVYAFSELGGGRVQSNLVEGVAGVTKFNLAAVLDPTINTTGFQYRFAIERNTKGTEPMAISDWSSSSTLSQVVLPFTQNTDEVSFLSVVAFVRDTFGAVSGPAQPEFIRLEAPPDVEVLEVDQGFDGDVAEDALRAQLAFASVVSRSVSISSAEGTADTGAGVDALKSEVFAQVLSALVAVEEEDAADFTTPLGELLMFVFREMAVGLEDQDRDIVEAVAVAFERVLRLWLDHIEGVISAAEPLNQEPNLAFVVPVGFIGVATEILSEMSVLPQICTYDFSLLDLHRNITDIAFAGKLAGQESFQVDLALMQSLSRKEFANNVAGNYQPPGGNSYLELPASLFDPGASASYDEVVASVFRSPPEAFCSEVAGTGNGNGSGNGTGTGDGDGGVVVIEEADQSGGDDRRALAYGDGTTASAAAAAAAAVVQSLVTDVLHLELVHNSSVFAASPRTVTAHLEVLYANNLSSAVQAVAVQCGVFDKTTREWSDEGCVIAEAVLAADMSNGDLVACECAGIDDSTDLAAWLLLQPVLLLPPVHWPVLLLVLAPALLLWLAGSVWADRKDRADALRIQKAASLALLFHSNRLRKSLKPQPRGSRASRFLLREAFVHLQVNAATVEARGGRKDKDKDSTLDDSYSTNSTSMHELAGLSPAKKSSKGPSAQTGGRPSLAWVLRGVRQAHSLWGTVWHFDATLGRVARSFALLASALAAFAGTALAAGFENMGAELGVDLNYDMDRYTAIGVAAILAACTAVLVRASMRRLALAERRAFHRVSHLQLKAREVGLKGGLAAAKKMKKAKQNGANSSPKTKTKAAMALALEDVEAPEQEELRARQLDLFLKKTELKRLKAQHDASEKSWTKRLARGLRELWFVPSGDKGAHRVYGGKVALSAGYRRQKRLVRKAETAHKLRPTSCVTLPRVALVVVLFAICQLAVFGIAQGTRYFGYDGLLQWTVDSMLALALSLLFFEPLLLLYVVALGASSDVANRMPVLAKPKTRYYSWDSRLSTRSLAMDRRSTHLNVDEALLDLEEGGRSGAGAAGRMKALKKSHRRASVVSAATAKTARSAVSHALGRLNPFSSRASGHHDKLYEDFGDGVFSDDEDNNSGYDTDDGPPSRRGSRSSRKSVFSIPSLATRRRSTPPPPLPPLSDIDEDADDFRPDDVNFV